MRKRRLAFSLIILSLTATALATTLVSADVTGGWTDSGLPWTNPILTGICDIIGGTNAAPSALFFGPTLLLYYTNTTGIAPDCSGPPGLWVSAYDLGGGSFPTPLPGFPQPIIVPTPNSFLFPTHPYAVQVGGQVRLYYAVWDAVNWPGIFAADSPDGVTIWNPLGYVYVNVDVFGMTVLYTPPLY